MNKYYKAWSKICDYLYEEELDIEEFHNKGGSGELISELVEKATPKKPIECEIEDEEYEDFDSYIVTYKGYKCSNCGQLLFIEVIYDKKPFCCSDCMQVVDWGEEDVD